MQTIPLDYYGARHSDIQKSSQQSIFLDRLSSWFGPLRYWMCFHVHDLLVCMSALVQQDFIQQHPDELVENMPRVASTTPTTAGRFGTVLLMLVA